MNSFNERNVAPIIRSSHPYLPQMNNGQIFRATNQRPIMLRPNYPQTVIRNPNFPSHRYPATTIVPRVRPPVFQNFKVTTVKPTVATNKAKSKGKATPNIGNGYRGIPELECDIDPTELPYPKSLPYIATDREIPCWNLVNEDPFHDYVDSLSPNKADDGDEQNKGRLNMKNSDLCSEVDLEEVIAKCKPLNGYELFALIQKKKFEKTKAEFKDEELLDDGSNSINNRIKEIWKFYPETTKNIWKEKAKRYAKLVEQKNKKTDLENPEKREKEIVKMKQQLDKHKITSCSLVDAAAYMKLLHENFDEMAKITAEFKGPITEQSMLSLLLDGLVTSMFPLLTMCNEIEELKNAPDPEVLIGALNNLTHIIPTLTKLN